MRDLESELPDRIEDIETLLDPYECRVEHFVADCVLFGYGADVVEHARAVTLVSASPVPRAAYSNARSAFEAGIEMLYLVSQPDEYDWRGCLARASELRESDHIVEATALTRNSYGVSQEARPKSAEERLRSDARFVDSKNPGSGEMLRRAYLQLVTQSPTNHWSGLSRAAMAARAAEALGLNPGFAHGAVATYSILSRHSHPRLRLGSRELVKDGDGKFLLSNASPVAVEARVHTSFACFCAAAALRARP